MSDTEKEIQSTGANIEEAISKGLMRLGADRSEVQIEVLDEGSSGFLGIGGRDAVVRISPNEQHQAALTQTPEEQSFEPQAADETDVSEKSTAEEVDEKPSADLQEKILAKEVVDNLLEKLQFDANTEVYETEPDDLTGETRWVVDISGEDLGMLIGTRGETLNALQHVARLMTGHSLRQRPKFIIDVQGYRSRREKALSRLAERMAGKVLKRGKPMTLEPMPPNERRIIHLTLRDDDRVYTESVGEGRQRKVQIFPAD
ncbi:MAG: RNA-binding cell elongation regulator Jag/EloR [Candidatus Promineifilaceae bacterium]